MTQSCFHVSLACQSLLAGQIIAYPTEAVFGLGCDPDDQNAIAQLLTLKQRPIEKGMILIASDLKQLQPYLEPLTSAQLALVGQYWPGPYTFVCPASARVSPLLSGGRGTLAVRVSAHPLVRQLCQRFGKPIVSTSANLTGQAPARNVFTVKRYFKSQLGYVLPGAVGASANPSQIRDLITGKILREA